MWQSVHAKHVMGQNVIWDHEPNNEAVKMQNNETKNDATQDGKRKHVARKRRNKHAKLTQGSGQYEFSTEWKVTVHTARKWRVDERNLLRR